MGIRFYCPQGHKLNVKEFQAGLKGICPYCGAKIQIPTESTREPSKKRSEARSEQAAAALAPASPSEMPAVAAFVEQPQPASSLPSSAVVVPSDPPTVAPAVAAPTDVATPAPSQPAMADPLAEGGDVVWYVRPASGGQFGPASPDCMRNWIAEGRVSADSQVWREGWRDWREASQVFPRLGAGKTSPPSVGVFAGETPQDTAAAARDRRARARRKSKNTQAVVIIVLIFAVLILSGVFLWVIWVRESGGETGAAAGHRSATSLQCGPAQPGRPSALPPFCTQVRP